MHDISRLRYHARAAYASGHPDPSEPWELAVRHLSRLALRFRGEELVIARSHRAGARARFCCSSVETQKTVYSYAHPIFWAPFSLVGEVRRDNLRDIQEQAR
jgi:hypothetical protein